jgi:ketol-acid reductoisomerase
MNKVISDTAEYGNYLFCNTAIPLLREALLPHISTDVIGRGLNLESQSVDNKKLVEVNESIRNHPVEIVGKKLRRYMKEIKSIVNNEL